MVFVKDYRPFQILRRIDVHQQGFRLSEPLQLLSFYVTDATETFDKPPSAADAGI